MPRRVLAVAAATAVLEVVMVGLAVAWVAVYSYGIAPGGDAAFYEEYAKRASPFVSLVAGIPVFGIFGALAGRRRGKSGARFALHATLLYAALDVALLALLAAEPRIWAISAIATSMKIAAVILGGRIGAKTAGA
jgi:hypothetical protein